MRPARPERVGAIRTAPAEDAPLTRERFGNEVARRDHGLCVLCGKPGTEAHHVLDRKLYPDGGYRLGNGAYVCNPCHWDVETTRVTVERVREAAGISVPFLPPGSGAGDVLDKWGNRIRPDGMREPGPLATDDGCRKALALGGFLGYLLPPEPVTNT